MALCRAGEVVELINTCSTDWWKGTSGSKKGYFPASYVQVRSGVHQCPTEEEDGGGATNRNGFLNRL